MITDLFHCDVRHLYRKERIVKHYHFLSSNMRTRTIYNFSVILQSPPYNMPAATTTATAAAPMLLAFMLAPRPSGTSLGASPPWSSVG